MYIIILITIIIVIILFYNIIGFNNPSTKIFDFFKVGNTSFKTIYSFKSKDAYQGVVANKDYIFAINNNSISKHNKSGKLIKRIKIPFVDHLNGGTIVNNKLYCPNNPPTSKKKNSIHVFDVETLKHLKKLDLPSQPEGSLTWINYYKGSWWGVFAFYKNNVHKTKLYSFNKNWNPVKDKVLHHSNQRFAVQSWFFPETVYTRFYPYSNSGGVIKHGLIYCTGHDKGEIYVLKIREGSDTLEHVKTINAPITGQGISWDNGTLYGIRRNSREVVAMRLT